jgi:ectoine hydroxylase-related dioxygenase (phytanoyl-CoA dioxygenase family)
MARLLMSTQQEGYSRDGFLFPIRVLAPDEARRLRQASDELEQQLGGRPRTVDVRQMHLHFRWAFELATHPRVLDAVEDVLGPNLLVWATELFAKHPEDETVSIGWHRDEPYMGIEPRYTTTAWIALGDSTPANGCLQVVRERAGRIGNPSHGFSDRADAPARRPGRTSAKEEPAAGDEIISVVLEAGQMSLHNATVLHGSGPNVSRDKRVGFVVRFVAPEARTLESRPPALLVRGRDDRGNFDLVEPLLPAEEALAVDGLRQSAMQHLDAVLRNLERCRC